LNFDQAKSFADLGLAETGKVGGRWSGQGLVSTPNLAILLTMLRKPEAILGITLIY
jgi:hypothetical protein